VGLGSAELGHPPNKFARYFDRARTRGYRTTVHAGEGTPASYVTEALDTCLTDRIEHGVSAAHDSALMRPLADTGIALTMCPLSNLALRVVRDLSSHPLRRLLHAGVRVTINSDDPPFFGGYINANYLAAAEALALDVDDVSRWPTIASPQASPIPVMCITGPTALRRIESSTECRERLLIFAA
jgi:adenosine deaminase